MAYKPSWETSSTPEEDEQAFDRFREWYESEEYGQELSPEDRHCLGIEQAIKAVFHLGQKTGFTQGFAQGCQHAREEIEQNKGKA